MTESSHIVCRMTRMPLPELRDLDKIEKAKALRESAKRVTLGPERLPSICFYTVLNGDQQYEINDSIHIVVNVLCQEYNLFLF
jgi:hypothetical protein